MAEYHGSPGTMAWPVVFDQTSAKILVMMESENTENTRVDGTVSQRALTNAVIRGFKNAGVASLV